MINDVKLIVKKIFDVDDDRVSVAVQCDFNPLDAIALF